MLDTLFPIGIVSLFTLILAWVVYVVIYKKPEEESKPENEPEVIEPKKKRTNSTSNEKKSAKIKPRRGSKDDNAKFIHPWLLTTLKGHLSTATSLSLSPNEKYLLSAGQDRSLFLWITKDFTGAHKQIKVNVGYESANLVGWSPDSKAFIISREDEKTLEVFKLGKKPDGSLGNIQSASKFKEIHKDEIIGLGIACNGKFIMSCSVDNVMIIWDLKGNILEQVAQPFQRTHYALISHCGRFVASGGVHFSSDQSKDKKTKQARNGPDVNVWKVEFKDSGDFAQVTQAFMLKEHGGDVHRFDFNMDSSKIATTSEDGMWRLFDTTGNRVSIEKSGQFAEWVDPESHPTIALSKKALLVLIGTGTDILIFSGSSGALLATLEGVHTSPISDLLFSEGEKYFISTGDKNIRVFHNVCGLQEMVKDMKNQIKDPNIGVALKNRLTEEIAQTLVALKKLT